MDGWEQEPAAAPMHDVTAVFEPVVGSVREVRHFVCQALAGWDADAAEDAALLASELATNAVIHAATPYRVRVAHGRVTVRVEVADDSRTTARRRHYGETAGTGRGLGMVEDLAADWGVELSTDGKVVWFELRAGNEARRHAVDSERSTTVDLDVDVDLDALLGQLGGWDDGEPTDGAPTLLAGTRR